MTELKPVRDGRREGEGALEDRGNPLDRWVIPYIEDSTLWPVLIVILAHAGAFLAPLLLWIFRDGRWLGLPILLWLLWLTYKGVAYERRVRERYGAFGAVLTLWWIVATVMAYYGDQWRIL